MKYLFPLPITYDGNESRYLQRDGARFAEYLTTQGHEAVKLIIDNNGLPQPSSPILATATWSQWCSPDFWKSQKADAVLLYGGTSPRLLPVAHAIKKNNIPLALKMDSANGLLPFPKDFLRLLRKGYFVARQKHSRIRSVFNTFIDEAKRASGKNFRFSKHYLPLFDLITTESEFANDNTKKRLVKAGLQNVADKVAILYHPVPNSFAYTADSHKKKQILAVAQNWRDPLKGGRLLAKTLAKTLIARNDYEALIIGEQSNEIVDFANRISHTISNRIHHKAKCNSMELQPYYRESDIFILCSGSEGAPNVVTEALCCGCSIVFPPELKQLSFISNNNCGTMASKRSTKSMSDALLKECQLRGNNERNPIANAAYWTSQMHVGNEVDRLINLLHLA